MHRIAYNLKKEKVCTFATFLTVILLRISAFLTQNIYLTPDSYNYIAINGFDIFKLNIDRFRVPLYPFIIEIAQMIFGDQNGLLAVCVLQLSFSCSSVFFFYKMLCRFHSHLYINLFFTALYGCSSAVVGWDKTILTESFCLSLTIYMAYFLISYFFAPGGLCRVCYGIGAAIAAFLGSFLRPTFSAFAMIAFLFFTLRLIFFKNERPEAFKCAAFLLLPIAAILFYASTFYKEYSAFTLSDSWCTQQVQLIMENGFYKDSTDLEIVDFIDRTLEQYGYPETKSINIGISEYGEPNAIRTPMTLTRYEVYRKFDRNRLSQFIKECLQDNPIAYFKYIIKTVGKCYNEKFVAYAEINKMSLPILRTICKIYNLLLPPITFGTGMLVTFIMICIWLKKWIACKEFDWICIGCVSFIASQYVLSVFGTFAEYPRTAIAAVPFIILSLFIIVNKLLASIRKPTSFAKFYDTEN